MCITGKLIEIGLTNGKHTVISSDIYDKIWGIREAFYCTWSLSKRFPFIKCTKKKCTKFRIRTHYETINDPLDPRYKADCSIKQFYSLFGVNVIPFEVVCVEGDLNQ